MDMNSLGRRLSVALLTGGLLSGTADAATQGSLGATSTGTVVINASVPQQVRISNLADVNFTNANPAVNASSAQNVCVWSNNANRRYRVTATGSGTASAFTIASGALPAIPYSVSWNNTSGATTGTALTSGTPLAAQTSVATKSNCSDQTGNASATLFVQIAAADLQDMQATASYTGTLTLLVAPD